MFEELYRDPARLEQFMDAMTRHLAAELRGARRASSTSRRYRTLCDVGGATGLLSLRRRRARTRTCAARRSTCRSVEPIAQKRDRAPPGSPTASTTASGDFFSDPLPEADVITMGMILHDWNLERKMHLIRAAYDALPAGRRVRRRSSP